MRGQGVAVEKKKFAEFCTLFSLIPKNFSALLLLFYFSSQSSYAALLSHGKGEDILTSGQFPSYSSLPTVLCQGEEEEKERERRKKNDQKINVFPKNNFSERSAKEKGFRFQDLVISLEMVRYLVSFFVPPARLCRVITIMARNFYFPLFGLWYLSEKRNTRRSYVHLFMYL